MARQHRSGRQSGWHHITNRGLDRQTVFRSDRDRLDFGRLIAAGCDEYDVVVLAYCLMDNHFHLVVDCPNGNLSVFMQQLSAKFTRHANDRSGGDGAIFRGRFFSRSITSNEYLLNAIRYVHRNPLDLRPRVDLAEYRWVSHRTYLGRRQCPGWLSTSPVLDWFSSPDEFDAFVRADLGPSGQLAVPAAELVAAIDHVIDEFCADLDRAPQGMARTVRYLLLDEVAPSTRSELVDLINPSSDRSLKQARWRSIRLANEDPIYRTVAIRAVGLVAPSSKLCLTQLGTQSQAGRLAS